MNGISVGRRFFLGLIALSFIPRGGMGAEKLPNLEGRWRVTAAEYQLTGPVTYTFRGDRLSVEIRQRDKDSSGATTEIVHHEEWKYAIDASTTPQTMVLKSIPPNGGKQETRTETIQYKDGWLFISGHNRSPGWNSRLDRLPAER